MKEFKTSEKVRAAARAWSAANPERKKDSAIEDRMFDNDWSDISFDRVDQAKLAEAQKLLDEALSGIVGWEPDFSVAVLLPKEET